jgi:hypothetical protein
MPTAYSAWTNESNWLLLIEPAHRVGDFSVELFIIQEMLPMGSNGCGADSDELVNLSIGEWVPELTGLAERDTDSGHGFSCIGTILEEVLVIDDGDQGVHRHGHLEETAAQNRLFRPQIGKRLEHILWILFSRLSTTFWGEFHLFLEIRLS